MLIILLPLALVFLYITYIAFKIHFMKIVMAACVGYLVFALIHPAMIVANAPGEIVKFIYNTVPDMLSVFVGRLDGMVATAVIIFYYGLFTVYPVFLFVFEMGEHDNKVDRERFSKLSIEEQWEEQYAERVKVIENQFNQSSSSETSETLWWDGQTTTDEIIKSKVLASEIANYATPLSSPLMQEQIIEQQLRDDPVLNDLRKKLNYADSQKIEPKIELENLSDADTALVEESMRKHEEFYAIGKAAHPDNEFFQREHEYQLTEDKLMNLRAAS